MEFKKTLYKYNKSNLSNKGFSLIEVLITLLLISLIFVVFSSNIVGSTSRKDMNRFIDKLNGAISFCIDESILKNKIIRLHFLLEKTPQEYKVEVASEDDFIRSKKKKEKKNDFSSIAEFEDGNQKFPDEINLIGLGDSTNKAMIYEGEASIYFYPNGSRDRSLIILNNDEEIVTVDVPSFVKKFNTEYKKLEESNSNSDSKDEQMLTLAKDIFVEWLK